MVSVLWGTERDGQGVISLDNQVSVLMMQNQQFRSFSAEMGTPLCNKMKTTGLVLFEFLGEKQSDCSKKVSCLGEHCFLCSDSLRVCMIWDSAVW